MVDTKVAVVGTLLALVSLVSSPAAPIESPETSEAAVPEGYSTGVHIVRPDDTLRKISNDYLGSQESWELNWQRNPEITNPDFLLPGQRLRVLMKPEDSVPSARVESLSGRVEGKPAPIGWNPAQMEDIVIESDGIRTFEQSSSALRFHDGTSLVMTEDSIVFLKAAGRTLRGIETRSVEIVEGQADLASLATDTGGEGPPEIEFVIGDATATPSPGPAGTAEARLRKSAEGAAQLMVFEGESQLAAAGATVSVPQGMGASVPEGEPPKPPEKLLSDPVLTAPGARGSLELGALDFSWESVDGAVGYTIEVCFDTGCQRLVARATGIGGTDWRASALPLGDLYWRVTATSPSGLDGYPADARAVRVAPTRAEFDAPSARYALAGRSVDRDGKTYYNPAVRVLVEVEDPSGVAGWQPLVDGAVSEETTLQGPWTTGSHRVATAAEDNLGNRGQTEPLSFSVDGEGPEIQWKVGDSELLMDRSGSNLESPKSRWWLAKAARRNARRVEKQRPPRWTLVGWGNRRLEQSETLENPERIRGLYRPYRAVRLTGDEPGALLLAPGVLDREGGQTGMYLAIDASDSMSGVAELSIRTVGSISEGFRLEATARDRLGNTSRAYWDFGTNPR